jgi:hypothetical protein
LTSALDEFAAVGTRRTIDLLAISHFDADHISGIGRLLERVHVRKLLLPYVPLADRLVAALASATPPSPDSLRFFFNPIEYLASREEAQIDEVVVVPQSREPGSDNVPDDSPTPDHPREDREGGLTLDGGAQPVEGTPLYSEVQSSQGSGGARRLTPVRILRRGGRIVLGAQFEFVPYNDAELSRCAKRGFLRTVMRQRDALLVARTDTERTRLLNRLKAKYDASFGRGSRPRNLISLFLYASPIVPPSWGKVATLYTGDGFLDSRQRLKALTDYLGRNRTAQIGCFQVMHHGSRENCFRGLTKEIAPVYSIFSSDPKNKKLGHPHREVRREFKKYGSRQVNKIRGFELRTWYV